MVHKAMNRFAVLHDCVRVIGENYGESEEQRESQRPPPTSQAVSECVHFSSFFI